MQDAAKIFDTAQIGKSCSRIDFDKLKNINFHYIKQSDDAHLTDLVIHFLVKKEIAISQDSKDLILKGMKGIKVRSHSIGELADYAKIYIAHEKIEYSADSSAILAKADKRLIAETISMLESLDSFDEELVKAQFMALAETLNVKLSVLMQPIRCLLTGLTGAPSVFEIISIIGKELTLSRLNMFYKI
jgi:glutamyl-tRNA synthetase